MFSDQERAALALAEEAVRIGDRSRVGEETWAVARAVFSDPQLAALLYTVGLIQFWNLLNVATEFPADRELPKP